MKKVEFIVKRCRLTENKLLLFFDKKDFIKIWNFMKKTKKDYKITIVEKNGVQRDPDR